MLIHLVEDVTILLNYLLPPFQLELPWKVVSTEAA